VEIAMTAPWRDTINIDDLWEGDMTAVLVDGEAVLLVNVDGQTRVIWTGARSPAPSTCGSSMSPAVAASTRITCS
jgi:hypothetical protein